MPYPDRRRRVLNDLADATLILRSAPFRLRSRDTDYRYRQDSDFFYLTGHLEPESILVLSPAADHPVTLFVQPRDPLRELWDGRRLGPERAKEKYSVDAAYPNTDFDKLLPDLLRGRERVLWAIGEDSEFDNKMLDAIRALRATRGAPPQAPKLIEDPRAQLHELRVLKDPHEQELMRAAGRLAVQGHLAAMRAAKPGAYEYEVQAEIEATFARAGASAPSYNSIVAGGDNACILHYIENDARLNDGELLLIDAGPELDMYAGDISSTFPVGTEFSPAQRDLYNAVLSAQREAIALLKPGATMDALHKHVQRSMTESLIQLGVFRGDLDELVETNAISKFYPHRLGHFLGIDVHDVGINYVSPGKGRPLAPGAVVTIEPGLYIPGDCEEVAEEFRGIGIRIEDDALVTSDGNEILTPGLPRSVDDIEAFKRDAIAGGAQ